MITVLVVEDSPTARAFIVHILTEAGIRVIGAVSNGEEALRFVQRSRPDVVTMDIHMPVMDGIEATRRIMETCPVPIVIVSGVWDPGEVEMTFRAMEAGALAIVRRPPGAGHPEYDAAAEELVEKVRLMAEVKVVRRWSRLKTGAADSVNPVKIPPAIDRKIVGLVAMGASTGGPAVLQTILRELPADFPAPILMVQHIAPGFLPGMVEWLRATSRLPLKIGAHGETVLPGHAYVAPDDFHMGVNGSGRILLTADAKIHGVRPSVSYLFKSVAETYGPSAVGVLLTGMGRDGAPELRLLKERGALTIAQNRETSVIYGMPAAAVELDAAHYVLSPQEIVATLSRITKRDTIA